jgi:hypothetical protein
VRRLAGLEFVADSLGAVRYAGIVQDEVIELLLAEAALVKLGVKRKLPSWSMTPAPWTDPEPQPGDFDADLAATDPRFVEVRPAGPRGKVRIVLSIEGEDARRLQRLSEARGEKPTELIAELLREADTPAA